MHTELVESKDLALTRGDFYEGGVLSKVSPRAFARTAPPLPLVLIGHAASLTPY